MTLGLGVIYKVFFIFHYTPQLCSLVHKLIFIVENPLQGNPYRKISVGIFTLGKSKIGYDRKTGIQSIKKFTVYNIFCNFFLILCDKIAALVSLPLKVFSII